MSNLREAAQQALETLENHVMQRTYADGIRISNTTLALRAALTDAYENEAWDAYDAALAESVQEPVAWMIYTEGGTSAYVTDNPNDLVGAYRALALYTAPPQRKPLRDEEILSVLRLAPSEPSLWPHLKDEAVVGDVQKAVLAIARAIERAHGIGGSDE